ncbi:MAG TPA: TetR/AcrR family transcriptional regulator [Thermoanaerobaculia bacterium]|nr:TetR/AcrR family transcriptional regulator [Thermoanaerobaculia bacterium]
MSGKDTSSARQDEILDRTIELIREAGMAGLTMKKVAERVGFTEPAIYRHFPNKQALLLGVAGRLRGMFLGPVRAISEEPGTSPFEKIERIVAHHIGLIVDLDGIPVLLLAEATASGDGPLAEKMVEISGTYLQIVAKLAGEMPLPEGSPPANIVVLPLMGLAAAVALQRRLLADRRISREQALELARFVVRRLLGTELLGMEETRR